MGQDKSFFKGSTQMGICRLFDLFPERRKLQLSGYLGQARTNVGGDALGATLGFINEDVGTANLRQHFVTTSK
jgi:hypothetical protein